MSRETYAEAVSANPTPHGRTQSRDLRKRKNWAVKQMQKPRARNVGVLGTPEHAVVGRKTDKKEENLQKCKFSTYK